MVYLGLPINSMVIFHGYVKLPRTLARNPTRKSCSANFWSSMVVSPDIAEKAGHPWSFAR